MKRMMIFLIKTYQFLKPATDFFLESAFGFHAKCKHTPSCSEFTLNEINKHGTIRGLTRGIRQIISCR